ncbi:hypothetical protein JZU68_03820, partial [bacterium]|nr:hypothetical protein [bacterium]
IVPQGTTAERPTPGAAKHIRFNTTLGGYEGYNGSAWGTFAGAGSIIETPQIIFSDGTSQSTRGLTGFRNKIINGHFYFTQRAASQNTEGYKSFDRWSFQLSSGSFEAQLISRTNTDVLPTQGVGSYLYLSGTGSAGTFFQQVENVSTFAGKYCVLSYYLNNNSGANTSNTILLRQQFGTGGSAYVDTTPVSDTVVSDQGFSRRIVIFNVPSIAGKTHIEADSKLSVIIGFAGTFAQSIWAVQLEEGQVATPFEQRPLGVELELCRRYYRESRIMGLPWNSQEGSDCGVWINGSDFYDLGGHSLRGNPMRGIPSMVFYDTVSGSTSNVRNLSSPANVPVTTAIVGTSAYRISTSAGVAMNAASWQWSADAEL